MSTLEQTIIIVRRMRVGQVTTFASGAIVLRRQINAYQVTDKNDTTYHSLDCDHAAIIAHRGE